MATRISSDGLAKTINADGYSVGGGTTKRTVTFTGGNQTFTGSASAVYTFPGYTGTLLNYKRTTVADVAYTATTSDYVIAYTTLTAARTITLPAANTMTDRILIIVDESSTPMRYQLTLDGNASELVNNALTWGFYGLIQIYSNGTAWYILDGESLGNEIAPQKNSIAGYCVIPTNYSLIVTPTLTVGSAATLTLVGTAVLKILPN